ncbi:glutamate decarboxylase [Aureobasidium subglaciale]|nr:glutamate decarboxylase [Aureobasidium subglaciale]KAI5230596.1 glutamate decarboxylase [Aureobasidium subglaciale]KAI5264872.1 glutamate decarboxylase [Aureobasidium subglaciale]
MVHLGKVTNDSEVKKDAPGDGIDLSKLGPEGAQPGDFGVYGSRFAEEDLPRHGMPEDGMPSQIAYRMIKDDLTLDGNPTLNLASFCTTYMEPEAEQLMMEALSKNFIDYEEYPVTADIQNRCVNMIARLFNIPTHDDDSNAMGTSTVGSSEAIMLATLAMKKTWVNKRKAEGKDYSKPNIIMNSAVQLARS